MKKILFVCALASFAFVACKSNQTAEAPAAETAAEEVACTKTCDSIMADSTACMADSIKCAKADSCSKECTKTDKCVK